MSEPVSRVEFFRPPLNPNGGGTVYVRPAGDEDEGRCAPDLLTQEPFCAGMPSPDELVVDTLRRESEALLTECTDKQRALFVRIVGNSLDNLSEDKLRSAYDLLRRTVWKNRNGRVSS